MNVVYIDVGAIADLYLKKEESNDWDEVESNEDAACLQLEREIAVEAGHEVDTDEEDGGSDDDDDDDENEQAT